MMPTWCAKIENISGDQRAGAELLLIVVAFLHIVIAYVPHFTDDE